MATMATIQQGPVVCGVQARAELIPALLRELERLDENAVRAGAPRAEELRRGISHDPAWWQTVEAELLLEELICALSDCAGAPELYFGREHPRSSVFGFWRSDD